MNIDLAAAAPKPTDGGSLRVMVVDDSAIIRGIISRWLEAESDLAVVATCRTGLDAVNQVERVKPDVVVLDIEMPDLDGISALPLLLAKKRDLVIIMASTLTLRNAEISLKALSLGASDYVAKPESTRELNATESFKHELVQKIRHLGARVARRRMPVAGASVAPHAASHAPKETSLHTAQPVKITLVPFHKVRPQALLIGSSTGGPQALTSLVPELSAVIDKVPVLITQHMPPSFTTILASHLARASGRPAREAVDGETVKAGHIYLAPGGFHMRVARRGTDVIALLDDGPQINFCRPAVDPLFMSAVDVWRSDILSLILTGMGSDGSRGAKHIFAAGGNVIAQDEASSVVWGMPGAVAQMGVCAALLPLNRIADKVQRIFAGDYT